MNQAEHLAFTLDIIEKVLNRPPVPSSDPLAAAWTALKDAEHAADVAQMRATNLRREYELLAQQRRAGEGVKP